MWVRLKARLYSFRWHLLAGLAGLIALVLLVVRKRPAPSEPQGASSLPEVPPVLQDRLRQAEEQALVARIEASAKAEAQKQELQRILVESEGAERRRRLASMLQTLR